MFERPLPIVLGWTPLLLATALVALTAAPGRAAEPHAILARGFEADQVYDFNGIDHVNLFNGNLVVTIPIGQRYHVNAGFEYGFTLVYNSHIWDYVIDCPPERDPLGEGGLSSGLVLTDPLSAARACGAENPAAMDALRGIPNPKSNAGTGWRLTLGDLYKPDSPLLAEPGWTFVAADGSEHRFAPYQGASVDDYPQFTRDGSRLRLRSTNSSAAACMGAESDSCMLVEHPGGVVYAFEPAPTLAGWRLLRIQDRFGNEVRVHYSTQRWDIEDSLGRQHAITFDAEGMVLSVELAAFGAGNSADYSFDIGLSQSMLPGCPHNFGVDSVEMVQLRHLNEITLPDGSRYGFSYVADEGSTPDCTTFEGRLESITLPTEGRIEYQYGPYEFPIETCAPAPLKSGGQPVVSVPQWGIGRRTVKDINGVRLAQTVYRHAGKLQASPDRQFFPGTCILPRTTYTDVFEEADEGHYKLTRHFFSVTRPSNESTDPNRLPGEHLRYGLPIDHLTPDDDLPTAYRSTMVFDCPSLPGPENYGPDWPEDALHLMIPRSCYDGDRFLFPEDVRGLRDVYLEHETGGLHYCTGTPQGSCGADDWRLKSNRTYFYDSPGHFFVQTTRSELDGYGRYRKTATHSNSPGSVLHDVFVNYLPEDSAGTWLLNLFNEKKVTEAGQTSRETYAFNRTTGFLDMKTSHRSGGNLVADFGPDGFGNIETETYSGGDPGRPGYVIVNEWQNGTLAESRYVQGSRTILRTVDAVIDKNTGLPEASRDASELETKYTFDALGRLTGVTQEGGLAEAATTYSYTKADHTRAGEKRASVTVTRGDTESQILFDGLGRPNEELTKLPDGTFNRRFTTFTPMGQADTVTTLHAASAPAGAKETETQYDVFGRPTHVVHPDEGLTPSGKSKSVYSYQGIFRTVRRVQDVETPEGSRQLLTRYFHDHQGRLRSVEEVEEHSGGTTVRLRTKYRYDEGGRLVLVTQSGAGITQERTFDYDGAGLLTEECHPELAGGCIQYSGFDAGGNPAHLRYDRAGGGPFELDYVYDGAQRLTQVRSAQDGTLLQELFYQNLYHRAFSPAEGNGKLFQAKRHNVLGARDIVTTVTNTYAGIGGRLSRRTVQTGGDGDVPRVRFTTGFTYDELGNVRDVLYPGCDQAGCESEAPARTIRKAYAHGALTAVGTAADPDRYAALSYHPNFTLDQILHGNGVRDDLAQDPSQMPRPGGVEVRTGASPGGGTLWQATYSYDGTGNLVSRTSRELTNAGSVLFDGTDLFRYDNAFNRLVSATVHYPVGSSGAAETRAFSYDPFGNLTSISGSNPRTLSPNPATNRLQAPFSYDTAGNLTSQPSWHEGQPTSLTQWFYSYDPLNMMTRAFLSGGSVTREYLYTADGERLAVLSPGRELWTLRGADAKVLRDVEYLSTGWRWVEDYIHGGPGLLATIGDVTGERHYHLDHLGSPRLVTDSAKQVRARHVYAPYGEELTAANQDELRLNFTGHERDNLDLAGSAGDLDYMHARFCNSHLGRFLSVDPVRGFDPMLPQSWNRYTYALNSPIKYVDPTGMYVTSCDSDDEQCNADAAAFEEERQVLLSSKDSELRAAAEAYGDPGDANGVTVGFGGAGGGTRTAAIGGAGDDGTSFKAESRVRIESGLSGARLREQVGHEGSHLVDDQAFIASMTYDSTANSVVADQSLNILNGVGEDRAYRISHTILVNANERVNYGCRGCDLGRGVSNPTSAIRKIIKVLYPNANTVLFPEWQ